MPPFKKVLIRLLWIFFWTVVVFVGFAQVHKINPIFAVALLLLLGGVFWRKIYRPIRRLLECLLKK
ncbi:hypothetical protein [Algivirga pacifica]|uniref:hypothetical protein n=1 Tax=Algivirga pacifica TaxID=1162670 RepID=UPI0031E75DC3